MWGPYDRTAYDRGPLLFNIFSRTLTGTYEMTANLEAILVLLVTLLGNFIMRGYRIRIRSVKLLRGRVAYKGSFIRQTQRTLRGTFEYIAHDFTFVKDFVRTLAGTYEVTSSFVKRMFVGLLGQFEYRPRQLKGVREFGWEFIGDFEAGDVIEIDGETLTITLNEVNAFKCVVGNIPYLTPGSNTLVYTDDEGTREIKLTIKYRGRWM